jgi:2-keto-4-pentenoate hydratase/2-oxohepta-3-ene-1,7-dioic acid hydratase (catechol pathway)
MNTIRFKNSNEEIIVPKIFCVGKNYARHAVEMKSDIPGNPVIFMKPSTAIVHDGSKVEVPTITKEMHHETEIFFVIGAGGKNLKKSDALKHIVGVGVGLDLTLRDVQGELKRDGNPWLISKGFDGSAPISEVVPVDGLDLISLSIRLYVDGHLRQHGSYRDTIFKVEEIIEYISQLFTLERGDLIFTGTPEGVASISAGDKLKAELLDGSGMVLTSVGVEIV